MPIINGLKVFLNVDAVFHIAAPPDEGRSEHSGGAI